MSLSGLFRTAAVAIPVALAATSATAQQVVAVPAGTIVVVMPGIPSQSVMPSAVPPGIGRMPVPDIPQINRLIAEQQAVMARMMADMNALFSGGAGTLSDAQTLTAGMSPAGGIAVCEESISIRFDGKGGAPLVRTSRSGNGCGPQPSTEPVPAITVPPRAPSAGPHVIEVKDPAPVPRKPVRHAT